MTLTVVTGLFGLLLFWLLPDTRVVNVSTAGSVSRGTFSADIDSSTALEDVGKEERSLETGEWLARTQPRSGGQPAQTEQENKSVEGDEEAGVRAEPDDYDIFAPAFSLVANTVPGAGEADTKAGEAFSTDDVLFPLFSRESQFAGRPSASSVRSPVSKISLKKREKPPIESSTQVKPPASTGDRRPDDDRKTTEFGSPPEPAVAESEVRRKAEEAARLEIEARLKAEEAAKLEAERSAQTAEDARRKVEERLNAAVTARRQAESAARTAEDGRRKAEEKVRVENEARTKHLRDIARKDFEEYCGFRPQRQWVYSRADGATMTVRITAAESVEDGTLYKGVALLQQPTGATTARNLKWLYSDADMRLYSAEADGLHPLLVFPVEEGLSWSWTSGDIELSREYISVQMEPRKSIVIATRSVKLHGAEKIEYLSRQRYVARIGLERIEMQNSNAKRFEMMLTSVE